MPAPLPRRDRRWDQVAPLTATTAAFPMCPQGRLPHQVFRGLLGVHSRSGLPARRVAKRPCPSKAPAASLPPLPLRLLLAGATLARWELHPLKNDTFARRTDTILKFALFFCFGPGFSRCSTRSISPSTWRKAGQHRRGHQRSQELRMASPEPETCPDQGWPALGLSGSFQSSKSRDTAVLSGSVAALFRYPDSLNKAPDTGYNRGYSGSGGLNGMEERTDIAAIGGIVKK